jgi:hypothetical protein
MPIPELPSKSQRLTVVLTGLVVLTGNPLNVTQSPQRQDFTASIPELPSKRQGLRVVLTGLFILTDELLNQA